MWVEFNPYDNDTFTGWIPLGKGNASGITLLSFVPRGFDPLELWPTNVWPTYVVYNGMSNTLRVEWIAPGVFDVTYTYDLGASPYSFTPPPPGQYYVVLGVTNGWCAANWQVYSYTVATS